MAKASEEENAMSDAQVISAAKDIQDLVTTSEIYSPSVYGCAYNIDPVYQENNGVGLQLSSQGKP